MFKDRADAGQELAEKLVRYRGTSAVVLALPRGGVVVGQRVARALGLPLDIIVTRKVGHPNNPEYALCAVDEKGTRLCEKDADSVDQTWLKQESERQIQEAKRRIVVYRGAHPPMPLEGKVAIIVDDGIATGLTMRLAVQVIKKQSPKAVVVAVPVAPAGVLRELRKEAEVVVLVPPEDFVGAVGAHYAHFEQVGDEEVVRLLSA